MLIIVETVRLIIGILILSFFDLRKSMCEWDMFIFYFFLTHHIRAIDIHAFEHDAKKYIIVTKVTKGPPLSPC